MSDFDEQAERVAFEKWVLSIHHSIEKSKNFDGDTIYNSGNTQGKWSAWLAARRLAHEENATLRAFARDVIREHQLETEGIQDLAVKHGLLAPVEATERCGADCACAEYGDFPQTCYRMTSALAPKGGNDAT